MKRTRALAVILSVALLAGLLSACGGKPSAETPAPSGAGVSLPASSVPAPPDLSAAVAAEFSRIYRIAKDRVYVNQDALDPVGSAIRNRLKAKAEGESQ